MSASRPQLTALQIADPAERWEELGFAVDGGGLVLPGVQIRFVGKGVGIVGWSVCGITAVDSIDGLVTVPAPLAPAAIGSHGHPNGAIALDHVVVMTPDFDRTVAALEEVGMPLRRVREVGGHSPDDPGAFRQGFRRLGPAILELVEARGAPEGPAAFWGLVVIVSDLDLLGERLGSHLSSPRAAVQPGRRIATLRRSAGLSPQIAFMDPEPDSAR